MDAFETSVGYRSLDPLSFLELQAKERFSDEELLRYAKDLFDAHLAEILRSTGEWHWKLEIREIAEDVAETLKSEGRSNYEHLRSAILEHYQNQYRVPTKQEYRSYLRGKREVGSFVPQEDSCTGDIEGKLTGEAAMGQRRTILCSEAPGLPTSEKILIHWLETLERIIEQVDTFQNIDRMTQEIRVKYDGVTVDIQKLQSFLDHEKGYLDGIIAGLGEEVAPQKRQMKYRGYPEQIILTLSNGYTLRSAGHMYELGAYVRICDEKGQEKVYWDADEWQVAPESVMGAILGALIHPKRLKNLANDQIPSVSEQQQNEKFLTWNRERLSYSQTFDARDDDGEEQIRAEELIAAHLFDEYEKFDLFGHVRWIIAFAVESFFQDVLHRPVEDILQLMETLPEYMATWQNRLTKPNEGPNEEEAATAGRDTLLLTLRFLAPSWVEVDSDH